MVNELVTRDQFNVTPDGVVHKPTDAAFIPNPSGPSSGTVRLGQLANTHPTAREYPVEDVLRIMSELWAEFLGQATQVYFQLLMLLMLRDELETAPDRGPAGAAGGESLLMRAHMIRPR